MAGYNGKDQSTEINLAVWFLISVSAFFLGARLWCRQHFARLWWDDFVLTVSWVGSPQSIPAATTQLKPAPFC